MTIAPTRRSRADIARPVLGAGAVVGSAVALRAAAARWARPPWSEPERTPVRAGALAVTVRGDGSPLLLLHGLVGSGRFWGGAYDVMSRSHRLIVPDLLGFGASERPVSDYGPDAHADAVAQALRDLGVDEPAIIGAHSLGTVVALRLALRHPELVRRITAFGPPLYRDAAQARRRIGASSPMAKLFALPGPVAEITCRWVCDHRATAAAVATWTNPLLPPPLARDSVEHTWWSYAGTVNECLLTGAPASWFGAISAPIHLVAGRSDAVADHAFLDELAARHDALRVEHWHGGHRLPLTDAARCIAKILG